MANKFYSVVSHNAEVFLSLYPTPQQNLMQCAVSQKNLLHCIPQRRRFSSVVSHNRRYFPPLWDTTEEIFFLWDTIEQFFFHCGIQWKRFLPLWVQWRKIIQRRMIFFNFKCLSLPSNKNLGKISYLNSQNNPWKELKMENYMVNYEIFFFPLWDTAQQRFF